jgi:2-dehydropantoate 2-reductase
MKIAIFGTGGVGGYFGGRLAAAGSEVAFIARGRQLAALAQHGLAITSPKGDFHLPSVTATDTPAAIGPVDVVLFTVKMYDVMSAAPVLRPLVGPDTVVITLQNGVEVVDMVAAHAGADHVAGGAAYIVATLDTPGRIRHMVGDRLVFGESDGRHSERLLAFQDAGRRAGFVADLSETIRTDLWVKFVRLGTWSGMTAVTRSPMGAIRANPDLLAMMNQALDEAIAVGRACGIEFPSGLVEGTQQMVRSFPHEAKSSMLEDLERGRRLELPWLSGAIVRLGREHAVPTPVHGFISAVLGPFVGGVPAPSS